ncbi:RGG repeats nuclear RNA binding protein A-like isoform X1 [Ananas comosus]|uniref:RGG repeats nuclear RNA binding protein A-like isoform X1 n=1 Tax=Ananas comosus TaxID=4615 RepID=A0A6P5GC51_ANACO|nr:RGG repeats nuclear RNA binding protein A-like isoform X1 [Ananas comosus]
MATKNPFDLLGDDESDDPTQLIAAQEQKSAAKKPSAAAPPAAAAKLPSKPVPPAQAVREARSNTAPTRGGPGRGGPGRGRGGRGAVAGQSRDFGNGNGGGYSVGGGGGYSGGGGGGGSVYSGVGGEDGDVSRPTERGRGPRQPYRGGRRGGYGNEGEAADELGRPPRRLYDRKSGTGRGYGMKREGAGRGNWGIVTDEPIAQEADETVNIEEKSAVAEKKAEEDAPSVEDKDNKEGESKEAEEKEQEDKEMTLDEYEKVKEEKRKALLALKAEERKVEIDKELQSMQQLSLKKGNDEVFIMLGSEKEALKKKENAERDERAKKSLSINEFLKPAEGERYYSAGGRGRGRGRGPFRGGFGGGSTRGPTAAPSIEDQEQFPTLSGK